MSYARYVDDTLFINKKKDISYAYIHSDNFDKNLKVTSGTFENSVLLFLDIEICPNILAIYHKHNQAVQYVDIMEVENLTDPFISN